MIFLLNKFAYYFSQSNQGFSLLRHTIHTVKSSLFPLASYLTHCHIRPFHCLCCYDDPLFSDGEVVNDDVTAATMDDFRNTISELI